jgi:hypothetical protein
MGLLLGFTVFGSALASYVLKERHEVPAGWRVVRRADKNHLVQLQIGLAQGRVDEMIRSLEDGER